MKEGLSDCLGTSLCIAWSSGLCQLLDVQYQPVNPPWAGEKSRWVLWARKSLGDVFQLGVFFFSSLPSLICTVKERVFKQ